jgi:hypothetical protein
MIPPGGKIQYTQSSISIENLIGQMMFSTPGAKPAANGAEGGAAPSPGPNASAPAPSPAPLAPAPAAPR